MPPRLKLATPAVALSQHGGTHLTVGHPPLSHALWRGLYQTADGQAASRSVIAAPRNARPLYIQSGSCSKARGRHALPLRDARMSLLKHPRSIRYATTSHGPTDTYEAVVVGAGPAGITAVGNLLENRIDRILWVDDAFGGGRVNKYYREVPSNTKVKLFMDFGTGVAAFRKIISGLPSRDRWEEPSASDAASTGGKEDKLQFMRDLDQEKGCQLSHAADMLLILTKGLQRIPGVKTQQGLVQSATLNSSSSTWTVQTSTNTVQTQRLILATGAAPNDPPLPYEPDNLKHLHLDTALSPTKLSALLQPLGPTTIAVIGASHSAILVLRNLADLAQTPAHPDLHIKWLTRHALRYAEYERDFIARDNTGLKGEAATWARENLEPDTLPHSPVSRVLTKIAYAPGAEKDIYERHLPGCAFVVQAIGYHRNPLPALRLDESGEPITPFFDHDSGVFHYARSQDGGGAVMDLQARVPGLYGAGIAFPERVVDRKYGHEEMNVGFGKFMKAVKRWAVEWKPVAAA